MGIKQHRYKCLLCGRDKFTRPHQPHYCAGGYRKHGIKSIKIETMENENKKLGQKPAFGHAAYTDPMAGKGQNNTHGQESGMSKRFYAACAAMQGLLGNQDLTERLEETGEFFHGLVSDSYSIADELLKQEDK